jgi:hypothetical protein
MTPTDLPYAGVIVEYGVDDPVFGYLLLAGPVVVAALVLAGRAPVTVALAAGYVAAFVGYVAYNGVR